MNFLAPSQLEPVGPAAVIPAVCGRGEKKKKWEREAGLVVSSSALFPLYSQTGMRYRSLHFVYSLLILFLHHRPSSSSSSLGYLTTLTILKNVLQQFFQLIKEKNNAKMSI